MNSLELRRLEPSYVRILALTSGLLTVLVLCAGMVVTAGWCLDNDSLKGLFADGPVIWSSVGVNTALLSLALLSFCLPEKLGYKTAIFPGRILGFGFCLLVFASGLATGIETFARLDLGLNHCWFRLNPDSSGISYPGPMTPDVSVAFAIVALGIALQAVAPDKLTPLCQWLCLASMMVTSLPLFGSLSGARALCTMFGCLRMSAPISALFVVLCLSAFLSRADKGPAAALCLTTPSGVVARRASLLLLFLPLLICVRYTIVQLNVADEPLSWALFGVSATVLVLAIVISGVKSAEASFRKAALKAISDPIAAKETRTRKVCLGCDGEFSADYDVCPECDCAMTRLVDPSLVGEIYADKYEIIWEIGAGGMARVYKARHIFLNQIVALKVLRAEAGSRPISIKRFQQEAQALAALSHPNIVSIQDFGFTPSGEAFLAMQYLSGGSLADLLDGFRKLNVHDTALIMLQVLDALGHAHGLGIVHRDLKPSNIMCSRNADGTYKVKVVDFGLAQINDDLTGEERVKLTQTGDCHGSPPYMSPEQCQAEKLDLRTDIYSLGCIFYECVTGSTPFVSESAYNLMNMHVNASPPQFSPELNLPAQFKAMVFTALQKDPEARQSSVQEMKDVLISIL